MWGTTSPFGGIWSSGKTVFALKKPRNWVGICDMNFVHTSDPVVQAQREYMESRVLSAQPAELIELL